MDTASKQPDILRTLEQEMDADMHPLLKMILDNIKAIGLGVAMIILSVAVYAWFSSYQEEQKTRAVSQLGKIIIIDNPEERVVQLTALLAATPEATRPAIQLELAKSYLELEKYDQAGQAWQALDTAGRADLQVIARLGAAKSFLLSGKYADAATALRALKTVAGEDFVSLVSNTLAFAEERAGNIQAALAEYEAIKAKEATNAAFIDYKISMLKQKSAS